MSAHVHPKRAAAIFFIVLFALLSAAGCGGPLHSAAKRGDINAIRDLIDKGADVNEKDSSHGYPPLFWATIHEHADAVLYLIEKGANVNAKDEDGETALYWPVRNGRAGVASLLIEKGTNVNTKSNSGETALHCAAQFGNIDIALLLIKNGAAINAKDNRGNTPLMTAQEYGKVDVARLLKDEAARLASAKQPSPAQQGLEAPAQQASTQQSITKQPASYIDLSIPKTSASNPSAIAIVIGNRDYKNRDVPSVDYAINDAEAVKKYLISVLGYKDGNVISLQNATKAEFEAHFGTHDDHKGILYNYLKSGKSDIFVYYSGHGAPDIESKKGYFVPSDANPQAIKLSGYPIDTLYANLAKTAKEMSAPNVFIVIDACFSGATEKGLLMKNASPITVTVANPLQQIPNAVVMTSSSASEISSWYPEGGHSMFTYFFLKSLKDNASKPGLTAGELFTAVSDVSEGVPYYARRMYGRSQTPQMTGDRTRALR